MGMGRVIKPEVFSRFRSTHLAWAPPRIRAHRRSRARGGGWIHVELLWVPGPAQTYGVTVAVGV